MRSLEINARRIILAGGFALTVAIAPAVAAFTAPSVAPSFGACTNGGEEEDLYTGECVPHTVPSAPASSPLTGIPGNPDMPAVDGVPCTGANSGQCIGLSEDAPQFVPPQSTVGSSPTVTGSIG
jgi:hypothetical protein